MSNLKVESAGIASQVASFQAQMGKMNTLLAAIQTATSNAKTIWQGQASDALLGQIEAFQKVFDEVTAQNEKYVSFLNSTVEYYQTEETAEIGDVSSNIRSYSVGE